MEVAAEFEELRRGLQASTRTFTELINSQDAEIEKLRRAYTEESAEHAEKLKRVIESQAKAIRFLEKNRDELLEQLRTHQRVIATMGKMFAAWGPKMAELGAPAPHIARLT